MLRLLLLHLKKTGFDYCIDHIEHSAAVYFGRIIVFESDPDKSFSCRQNASVSNLGFEVNILGKIFEYYIVRILTEQRLLIVEQSVLLRNRKCKIDFDHWNV